MFRKSATVVSGSVMTTIVLNGKLLWNNAVWVAQHTVGHIIQAFNPV